VRVAEIASEGRQVRFDHGALRTVVSGAGGALPSGFRAFSRILEPLGFRVSRKYPLPRLHMMGRSFTHQDFPDSIAQFFVSEISLSGFSSTFQQAAERVIAGSGDPLSADAVQSLTRLSFMHSLPYDEAVALMRALLPCFGRQHPVPALADYEQLLGESAEMAWIATEGNTFNHVTERVDDIEWVADAQKKLGRPMKSAIEVSASGRIRQTAYRATLVEREFLRADGSRIVRRVPGSFYEFIQRAPACVDGESQLDLSFDSSNAQGIFRMTDVA